MAVMNPFQFGTNVFDPSHRFETSWLLTPWVLFSIRATIFVYTFVVIIFGIIWYAVQPSYGGTQIDAQSFSYFTNLTYWGITFYFLFSALHTFSYARHGTPYLNRWPRPLQALHSFFYTTIITYPFLVTIVFWAVIYVGPWYTRPFNAWNNISKHAMNSLFALFELLFTRTNPPPWIHLLWLLIILALYLGVAYLTHYTEGIYVYSFLDPSGGRTGRTAGYILGIMVGIIVISLITKGIAWGRKWVTEKKWDHMGKFHGGRSMAQGDSELEAARMWEK